ncbi:MAG: fibronectin type III domain-containing protein [Terriglobales bacterium]
MRGVPVAAALLVVSGIYFQAVGNSGRISKDNGPVSLASIGAEKNLQQLTEPRLRQPTNSASLISQLVAKPPVQLVRHRVRLSWKPSEIGMGNHIVGYNVYRGSGANVKFSKLNSDPIPVPEYIDDQVRSGWIYYYATTAVNESGRQSRPSTIVTVAVPFP